MKSLVGRPIYDSLDVAPRAPNSGHYRKGYMQRLKNTEPGPPPPPGGNWLVGMVIGSAIMTMATQAMLFGGATAAIKTVTARGG